MANIYRVYKITNTIDDKIYIGSTKKTLVERFKKHLYDATCNGTIKLYIHMRKLGFEKFNIELVQEEFTSYPKYLEQLEINKYDKSILLNMIAANVELKITPHKKSILSKYQQKRIKLINKIKERIIEHNKFFNDNWDVNLINFDAEEWILKKLLSKINNGIFTELFSDGRLCFYN